MSLIVARKKRSALYLSIVGVVIMVAAVIAISARDPDGVSLRAGMVMVVVVAAIFLPWYQLVPAIILTWLLPDAGRALLSGKALFNLNMMLELPGLLGLGGFAMFARESLGQLEHEMMLVGADRDMSGGVESKSSVFQESRLLPDLSAELARSRRFGRSFALVLVGIDDMRARFDYRNGESWNASHKATAELLRGTRSNVDRVYLYGASGYALLLPESTEKDVKGLVRRLRRTARKSKPAEGEAGGPFPVHYGATFFPACATSTDDLLRRAEVAMRIAEKSPDHLKVDTAAAPELAPAESLRRPAVEEAPDAGEATEHIEAEAKMMAPQPEPQAEPELAPVITFEPRSVVETPTDTPEEQAEAGPVGPEPVIAEAAVDGATPAAEPVAVAVSKATSDAKAEATATPESFDDEIAGLLAHLDETLGMIRSMKATAA